MTNEEVGAAFFLVGYAVLILLAVKAFGLRRVLWAMGLVVFLAVVVAFKMLGALTGGQRY